MRAAPLPRLLLDQNLSPRLGLLLGDAYPGISHVRSHGLGRASDPEIWRFALAENFAIVSKDSDFHHRSFALSFPPKVVWLRVGNCPAVRIESLLRERLHEIETFLTDDVAAFLALS
jgi:predicted nuclease of predicted toxin-antitoxin system